MNESVDRYFVIGDNSDDTFEYNSDIQTNDKIENNSNTNYVNMMDEFEDTEEIDNETEESDDDVIIIHKEPDEKEVIIHKEQEKMITIDARNLVIDLEKIIKEDKSKMSNNEIKNAIDELDNIIGEIKSRKEETNNHKFVCHKCAKSFSAQYLLDEHKSIHDNEIENIVCICKRCGGIYNSDMDYLNHKSECNGVNNTIIPTDENGKYPCPACGNKYSNAFYLGEHFIANHAEYDDMRVLDEKHIEGPLGFPGFELLRMIGMIDNLTDVSGECKICYFDFEFDIFVEEMSEDNKNPLILNCCQRPICCSCLLNHISINNNIICPFCMKDHTRNDLDYIKYIIESNVTNREKWIEWWTRHLEIFY